MCRRKADEKWIQTSLYFSYSMNPAGAVFTYNFYNSWMVNFAEDELLT